MYSLFTCRTANLNSTHSPDQNHNRDQIQVLEQGPNETITLAVRNSIPLRKAPSRLFYQRSMERQREQHQLSHTVQEGELKKGEAALPKRARRAENNTLIITSADCMCHFDRHKLIEIRFCISKSQRRNMQSKLRRNALLLNLIPLNNRTSVAHRARPRGKLF